MAHSMGVINLRITSSVSSSGQCATKLRMAVRNEKYDVFMMHIDK